MKRPEKTEQQKLLALLKADEAREKALTSLAPQTLALYSAMLEKDEGK